MKKSLLDRMFRPSLRRRHRREFQRLQNQFRAASDPRRLDFDWAAINFNRIAVVNLLLANRPDANYLEIGCAANVLFDSVIAKHKVGVDPEQGGTHRLTSDDFFRNHGDERYDVVFLDGLHTYEQTHRDVVNALLCVPKGGWIGLHDMIPRDWLEEHVPRLSNSWSGDVWKVSFELAQSPDIDFRLFKIDHGVGVFRVLKDGAQIPDLSSTLADKRFGYLYENFARLPAVDYETGRAWIDRVLSPVGSPNAP